LRKLHSRRRAPVGHSGRDMDIDTPVGWQQLEENYGAATSEYIEQLESLGTLA